MHPPPHCSGGGEENCSVVWCAKWPWLLHIDSKVPGIIQRINHVSFNRRDKVKAELKKLMEWDIIEHVDTPSEWVSPLRVMEKRNGTICLCVDMRRTNTAVKCMRYPIPTLEQTLHELSGCTVFTKLVLNVGLNQIELAPEPWDHHICDWRRSVLLQTVDVRHIVCLGNVPIHNLSGLGGLRWSP